MAMIEIEAQPWTVPNFVNMKPMAGLRQDGWKEAPSFPLSEIDASVLANMCDDFRAEVFRKAGKADPAADRKEEGQ